MKTDIDKDIYAQILACVCLCVGCLSYFCINYMKRTFLARIICFGTDTDNYMNCRARSYCVCICALSGVCCMLSISLRIIKFHTVVFMQNISLQLFPHVIHSTNIPFRVDGSKINRVLD